MKQVLIKNKLIIVTLALFSIINLFTITSLFAAQEGKKPEKPEKKTKN